MSSPEATPNGAPGKLPGPAAGANGQLVPRAPRGGLVQVAPAPEGRASITSAPYAVALLKPLRRRSLLAATLGLVAACAAAARVWPFLPPAKQSVYAKLYMPTRPEHILYERTEAQSDFASFQRTQVALIKSRLVLNAALRNPKVAQLDLDSVRKRMDPVE